MVGNQYLLYKACDLKKDGCPSNRPLYFLKKSPFRNQNHLKNRAVKKVNVWILKYFTSIFKSVKAPSQHHKLLRPDVPPGLENDGWKKIATCIESATPMTKTCNFYIVEYVVRLMEPLGNFSQNQLATRCQ